jgi:shikimate dehydrogenase
MSANVTNSTGIVAIYGYPIEHSLSPSMHNAAFRELGLDIIYLPIEVKRHSLKGAIEAIRVLNFIGVNLTHPHKVAVIELLDDMSEEAEKMGAVNTVVNEKGTLIGYNTDGVGFMQSLKEDYGFNCTGKNVVVFGAGGAGRAICWAISQETPQRLAIVNRTFDKARTLAKKVAGCALSWDDPKLKQEIYEAHLLVNATSTSMNVDHHLIREGILLYNVAYGHNDSSFLQDAKKRGARVANGLSMLLYQGGLAFELWTGRKAPLEVMRKALWQGGRERRGNHEFQGGAVRKKSRQEGERC